MGELSQELVKKKDGPEGLIQRYRTDFSQVLPSHVKPDTWLRLAQGALRRNPDLARAAERNPGSFLSALLESARLGHEPGTSAFYLVPYGGEVQGLEGYQGKIDRMFRAGQVASVVAEVVFEKDGFHYKPGPGAVPDHSPYEGDGDPGKMVRVYAYAQMHGGAISRVVVLTKQQVEQEHRAHAKGATGPKSPWNTQARQMWLKSAVHELEKWVPTSTEYRGAALVGSIHRIGADKDAEPCTEPLPDEAEPLEAELVD